MSCRETERLWNALLDARDQPSTGIEQSLFAHEEVCAACRQVGARYRTLRQAIAVWVPATIPVASPKLLQLPSLVCSTEPPVVHRVVLRAKWVATAAAVMVASIIGLQVGSRVKVPPARVIQPTFERSLSDALADATSATLELARETSAPAGRVGRVVWSSTRLPNTDVPLALRVSNVVPTSAVLRSVGERVGAGVRPLSGSARQAFGFLVGATGEEPRPATGTGPGT